MTKTAELIARWASNVSWDENPQRTDATMKIKVNGINYGELLSLYDALEIKDVGDIKDEDIAGAVHLLARHCCSIRRFNWNVERFNLIGVPTFEIFIYAEASVSEDEDCYGDESGFDETLRV